MSTDTTQYQEERARLRRYLSDEIPPMIFADTASVLFEIPPQIVAGEIHSWIGDQYSGASSLTTSDLLYHAAKKIHLLGELDLIPKNEIDPFIKSLQPFLMQLCPAAERLTLEKGLSLLEASQGTSTGSIEVLHRPTGAAGGGLGGAGTSGGGGVPESSASIPGGRPPMADVGSEQSALHRLNFLLDRLESFQSTSAGSAQTPSPAQHALISQVVDEVASKAETAQELEGQLGLLEHLGISGLESGVFRLLSQGLPDWAAPPRTEILDTEPTTSAERAMRKMVTVSKDSGETMKRFSELVTVAIEEFNKGSLGRAVTIFDLATRMIREREIDESIVKTVIDQTYPTLDHDRLRELSEDEDKHILLRRAMRFFPPLTIDGLLSDLIVEEQREQRRLLLQLMTVHGTEAREAVTEALRESVTGANPQPWYVERNLVYLLRSIPHKPTDDLNLEIDVLIKASELEGPLPLVRESLTSLGHLHDERAEAALVARVCELEDFLLGAREMPREPDEARSLLDTTLKLLAQCGSPETRAFVITHGLKRQSQLGNTLARLAQLGEQDLSHTPELVERIIHALEQELPRKILGLSMKTQRGVQLLENMIQALAGTDTPAVRRILSDISSKYSGQEFAAAAARTFAALGKNAGNDSQTSGSSATLTGDLALFGLPNLLQNLADTGVTGRLTVIDETGATTAAIDLVEGMMTAAEVGKLKDEVAIFQLLERPTHGRFIFDNPNQDSEPKANAANAHSVRSLLFEGIRRFDEFSRAAALVPDDAQFKSANKKPTDVKDDADPKLAKIVWADAVRGVAPAICESALDIDPYRVRRLYEHWVAEGSLVPKE
ncbi:MAG: DUF4388 domain-containing protein [Thermoanaerobaculales bacterium]